MKASYTKLRDGSWGLRIEGDVQHGQTVTVTTKAGKTKTERIDKVLWRGENVALCSIAQHRSGRRGDGRTTCKECGRPIEDAPHHRAMGGLCGACAFDEYDM